MTVAIFDFDGTLTTGESVPKEYYEGNKKVIELHQKHRENGTITHIITARPITSMMATKVNCRMLGIYPSKITVNKFNADHTFKKKLRNEISKNWNISHNYGNNPWDFEGSEPHTKLIKVRKDGGLE